MKIYSAHRINNRMGDMQNLMNVTLMMVILAFFIVLNSLAVPAEDKKKKALGSFTGSLGILQGGTSPWKPTGDARSLLPGSIANEEIANAELLGKFEKYLMAQGSGKKVSAFLNSGGVELNIESSLMFPPGSASLTKDGEEIANELAGFLSMLEGELVVESHTNDRKITSARYGNATELTIARAGTLTRVMIKQGMKKKGRIAIAGYGSSRPIVPNNSKKNRAKNDRMRIAYKFTL